MRLRTVKVFAVAVFILGGCSGAPKTAKRPESSPPMAKKAPKELEQHGRVRVDNYYWINERSNPEVRAYLEQENAYTDSVMAPYKGFENKLFEEIKGRIKQDDSTVPYKWKDYYYYTRFEEGGQYPIHCRKKLALTGSEEIMLDVNEMAGDHEFFNVGAYDVSSSQDIIAYPVDTAGRRIYTIRFKNLETGNDLGEELTETTGNMAWANDNKTLFYTRQDPVTLRWYSVFRHKLGSDPAEDVLVYEEKDDTFETYVWKTKSEKYILLVSNQTLSSEYRYLDADDPDGEPKVFWPREKDHEYSIDHLGDNFFIRTNFQARNFRLMKTPVDKTAKENWVEVIPHREDVLFEGFSLFKDFLVVGERKDGLVQICINRWEGGENHCVDFGEPAYRAGFGENYEMDTNILRFEYSSMTTPDSIYDYDMVNREKKLLKRDEVLGGFDQSNYITERLHATAKDGAEVPISIVYRKDLSKDGTNPLLLYGYGSYGYSMDAGFSSSRLSLLDRGFVFAIAHVRGGEELGRKWYEDGKLKKKINTFTDFIACAEHLIKEGYTKAESLFAMGGSAGGLLMGAVVNMRPDLFKGIIAEVPFVDVVTTMLDDSIPLTTSEFDEWGDPKKEDFFDYMLSYSPYDNVEAKDYPNMLVTTGLNDSQVQYWEPAKWVAKLRALKTDNNLLLLKTDMESGHGGPSGRFRQYRETAFYYTFLLTLAGKSEK